MHIIFAMSSGLSGFSFFIISSGKDGSNGTRDSYTEP